MLDACVNGGLEPGSLRVSGAYKVIAVTKAGCDVWAKAQI